MTGIIIINFTYITDYRYSKEGKSKVNRDVHKVKLHLVGYDRPLVRDKYILIKIRRD